jgi:hypothetical protein
MALTYTNFQTFAEVEAHYNSIKPLVSKLHPREQDLRPIGDRQRKWERIVKISDNCYALSDGYHHGDELFNGWYYGASVDEYTPTLADMEKYAPIVWRKRSNGVEEVTLRNGWGPGAHQSRYAFLKRHTPYGMLFRVTNGKQFIRVKSEDFYLAKRRTTPRPIHTAIKMTPSNHYWQKRMTKWVTLTDDDASLTFSSASGSWVKVAGGAKMPTPPKVTVKKDMKDRYKADINTFKEWAFTMGALLPIQDYAYIRDINNEVFEWNTNDKHKYTWGNPWVNVKPKQMRDIMCTENHPMRLHLAVTMLRSVDFHHVETVDDVHRVKQRANNWINKQMGFTKKG